MSERVGPYVLHDVLGEGGEAVVYRARQLGLDRDVALKVLTRAVVPDSVEEGRYLRELSITFNLRHPGLVRVLDTGTDAGRTYIAMELVRGLTGLSLMERIQTLPAPAVWSIASDVAATLTYLHDLGVVHRDLKPSNILIDMSGNTKLVDFGIARGKLGPDLTATNMLVGTIAYLAPEVLDGGPATAVSDLWCLGLVLYALLTGRRPNAVHAGGTTWSPALMVNPLAPPVEIVPGVGANFSRCVMSLLVRDPTQRCSSAQALLADLGRCLPERDGNPRGTLATVVQTCSRSAEAIGETNAFEQPRPAAPIANLSTVADLEQRPAGRRKRRTSTIWTGMILLVVILLYRSVHLPGRASAVGRRAETNSTPPPSPATPRGLLSSWREIERLLPRLHAGGDVARSTVNRLRTEAKIDVGDRADLWIHWIDLGRWLAQNRTDLPAPRWPQATSGPMSMLERAWEKEALRVRGADLKEVAQIVLRSVTDRPDDGLAWMQLGMTLSMEQAETEASLAYRVGLGLFTGTIDASASRYAWASWLCALRRHRRSRLAGEVWRVVMASDNRDEYWHGLQMAFASEPDVFEEILRRAPPNPEIQVAAITQLARIAQLYRSDAAQQIKILEDGYTRYPSCLELRLALVEPYILRGRSTDIRRLIEPLPPTDVIVAFARALLDGTTPPLPFWTPSSHDLFTLRLEVWRLLERGKVSDAERVLQVAESTHEFGELPADLWFAIVAHSNSYSQAWERCQSFLHIWADGNDVATSFDCCGILLSSRDSTLFQYQVEKILASGKNATSCAAIRALWHSRALDPLRALHDLTPIFEAGPASVTARPDAIVVTFEVLARIFLYQLTGDPQARAAAREIRGNGKIGDFVARANNQASRTFLDQLAKGRLAEAIEHADTGFNLLPVAPLWGEIRVLGRDLAGRRTEASDVRRQLQFAYRAEFANRWVLAEIAKPLLKTTIEPGSAGMSSERESGSRTGRNPERPD